MDNHALIQQLCSVVNVSEDEAKHLLEAFHWNLEEAIQSHFDTEQNDDVSHEEELAPISTESNPSFIRNLPEPPKKIGTLDSLHQTHTGKEGTEEGQAFYVGGSETGGGGQQVLGPPKKSTVLPDPVLSPDEFVHSLFQAARGQGAEVFDSDEYKSGSKTQRLVAFSGTGYRLGEDHQEPSIVDSFKPGTSTNAAQPGINEEKHIRVKLWSDGFSVDEGPLRAYTDAASQTFLDDIRAGRVPQELLRSMSSGLVNVLLEDHRAETWRAPVAPKVVPFTGKSKMLGHPVPQLVVTNNTVKESVDATSLGPCVNEAEPSTQLQVRLPDGGRLTVRLNHSHTIGDLRRTILGQRPSLASSPFVLMTTFPSEVLKNDSQSLLDANLLNSVVLVRPT